MKYNFGPAFQAGPGRPPLKRRRTSSVASGSKKSDDESDSPQEPMRKRKKLDPMEMVHQLYELIRNHKKDDGTLLCDAFIRVPKRRQEPGYYEVVSNPIDLLKIQQKLKTDEYEDLDQLQSDIELLVNNAKAFYKRNSQEHKDACEFWELFLSTKQKILEDPKSVGADDSSDSKSKIILKVGKLMGGREGWHKLLIVSHNPLIVSHNQMILSHNQMILSHNPLILSHNPLILSHNPLIVSYNLLIMSHNLLIVSHNPLIVSHNPLIVGESIVKEEVDYQPVEKKRRGPGRPPKEERKGWDEAREETKRALDRDTDDTNESWSQEDELSFCEDLFTAVMTATDDTNRPLHLVFQLLPSKKRYPKYYEVIDNPIDLRAIARKIQESKYTSLNEMEKDLLQMTRNACTFNEPGSQIYKDAKALRKIILSKKIEVEHSKFSSGKTSERIRSVLLCGCGGRDGDSNFQNSSLIIY
ncbi:Protein polybromo-1 [Homalodisca vitripennis]|nr:Protein polybromo-1 [Homalodisca vitripennis]